MATNEKTLLLHREWKRKLEATSEAKAASKEDLTLAYIPGVAEPYKVIATDPEAAYRYTIKSNTIAVVSNGNVILSPGNTGPLAAMPVMEGKTVLFKEFGGVNAFPIRLDTQDTQEIIETVVRIIPVFGGINLEDISAPRYSEIEEASKGRLDIPMFRDDQHGTAIVILADVVNSLKLTGEKKEDCHVVISGTGSAGIAITKLLLTYGFAHITMCGRGGILSRGADDPNWIQEKVMDVINLDYRTGTLAGAMKGADIFMGVSAPGIVTQNMMASMSKDAILFTMANPVPEIMSELARTAGARVVGIGHSDFPNQVNNVVVFPGIFKGTLEGRASATTEEMKLAVAEAIAGLVDKKGLNGENILPEAFDPRVTGVVNSAVKGRIRK